MDIATPLIPVMYLLPKNEYWGEITITLRNYETFEGWAITRGTCVISKSSKLFCYEHLPSSRTEEQLSDTRFVSPESAAEFYQKNIEEINSSHHAHPKYTKDRFR